MPWLARSRVSSVSPGSGNRLQHQDHVGAPKGRRFGQNPVQEPVQGVFEDSLEAAAAPSGASVDDFETGGQGQMLEAAGPVDRLMGEIVVLVLEPPGRGGVRHPEHDQAVVGVQQVPKPGQQPAALEIGKVFEDVEETIRLNLRSNPSSDSQRSPMVTRRAMSSGM